MIGRGERLSHAQTRGGDAGILLSSKTPSGGSPQDKRTAAYAKSGASGERKRVNQRVLPPGDPSRGRSPRTGGTPALLGRTPRARDVGLRRDPSPREYSPQQV